MPKSRDHVISIRFKPEEYAELTAKAGAAPIGTFVRETVLDEAAPRSSGWRAAPVEDHTALAQILALLGPHPRIQEFKRAARQVEDGTAESGSEVAQRIAECHSMLADVLSLLMRALGAEKR